MTFPPRVLFLPPHIAPPLGFDELDGSVDHSVTSFLSQFAESQCLGR